MASPLLTRLYSPEDFGLLAVFAALLGILSVIASLRYQLAIPLPESDEEAAHVVVLGLIIVADMSLLATVLVIFFAQPIADVFNTPALASYLWLLPLALLLSGIYQVFNYWAIRVKAFTPIARTKLTQAIATVSVQLGGYLLGPLARHTRGGWALCAVSPFTPPGVGCSTPPVRSYRQSCLPSCSVPLLRGST
nr:oligosaccharide flippase family protein [Ectothiorhodospira sp. 9100]